MTPSQVTALKSSATFGASPWLGQAAQSVVDPGGLNLTSTATYEPTGTGYFRQLTSVKPAGSATTTASTYYLCWDLRIDGANSGRRRDSGAGRCHGRRAQRDEGRNRGREIGPDSCGGR